MVGNYIQYPSEDSQVHYKAFLCPVKVLLFRPRFFGRLDFRHLFSQLHLYDEVHLLLPANSIWPKDIQE
jgi:hypothetical protein